MFLFIFIQVPAYKYIVLKSYGELFVKSFLSFVRSLQFFFRILSAPKVLMERVKKLLGLNCINEKYKKNYLMIKLRLDNVILSVSHKMADWRQFLTDDSWQAWRTVTVMLPAYPSSCRTILKRSFNIIQCIHFFVVNFFFDNLVVVK